MSAYCALMSGQASAQRDATNVSAYGVPCSWSKVKCLPVWSMRIGGDAGGGFAASAVVRATASTRTSAAERSRERKRVVMSILKRIRHHHAFTQSTPHTLRRMNRRASIFRLALALLASTAPCVSAAATLAPVHG